MDPRQDQGRSPLNPVLLHHLPAIVQLSDRLVGSGNSPEVFNDMTELERAAIRWLTSCRRASGVYAVPLLRHEFCDHLVKVAGELGDKVGFTPNEDEDEAYQIPELVLEQVCPPLYDAFVGIKETVLDHLNRLLFGFACTNLSSAQFARYSPENTARGNWHLDGNSDLTAVVSLQPERFEGGGTSLRTELADVVHVPKLCKGTALMFRGASTMHQGEPVTEGVRDLLVLWMENE